MLVAKQFILAEFSQLVIFENETLKIHRLLLNEIKTNCFIIQNGKDVVLVDPTNDAEAIIDYIKKNEFNLKYMLTTHGHFDHISAASGVIEKEYADVLYVHEADFAEVKRGPLYSLSVFKRQMKVPKFAMYSDELLAFLEGWGLLIEKAGGHTKGSCFIYDQKKSFIITGDLVLHHKLNITLFNSMENLPELSQFIRKIKNTFALETIIFPGHGDRSTLKDEVEKNQKWAYVLGKEA